MKELSQTAKCSKAIREELKKIFPDTKFRVISEPASGINIYYIDGPSRNEICKIVSKYEMGHFDGMQDIYEYSNRREDIPQVKYVFITREISLERGQEALGEFNRYWDREDKPNIHDSYHFEIPVIGSIQDLEWNQQWREFINKYNFSIEENV